MLRLIFTLFFISIPAFAIDSIYTWGYGEDIRNILISIKFFTANATYLINTVIALGLLFVMYKETREDNTDRIMKVGFLALIVSQLFFHSTKDYMVEDEVTNQAFVVTNVPVGIGELFSLFTTTERVLIKAFESSYSTPNSLNFSQVGLGFSMAAHLSTNDAMFKDTNSHETFMEYTTNCIANGMIDGQIDKNIIMSEDIVGSMRVQGFETIVYYKNFGEPEKVEQTSCQNAYDNYILKYFSYESNDYIHTRLAAQMELEGIKLEGALEATSELFFGISKSGQDYIMQQMGKNMLKKGLEVMAITTGGDTQALAYGLGKSSATMENQWQQAGIMTQSTLPMIKAYLTSIILAITPLLALLSIMFGDWKYIKMIVTLLTTLMLFSPLASIINYLMYLRLETIIPVFSSGMWMPILAMRDINSQIFSYLNFLGYAAMFIPILAYSLVKASEQGFVNFMSSMGGAASSAGNAGAGDKVNGVNMGNTNVGKGAFVGKEGITTDMGGDNRKTEITGGDNVGGVYSGQSTTNSNGDKKDELGNEVSSWKANNGKLTSVNMDNLSVAYQQAQTDTYTKAKATEKSSSESMSNTLSAGISSTMANGQIYTNSDDFSKNTGLNNADSSSIVQTQNEAIVNNLNKKLSEAQTNNTTADAGFRLSGHAGWGTEGSILGITGMKAGVDGSTTISGTSTDGKSFSVDMSKDEMASLQKSVSDSLAKTFTTDSGLALRASKSLANNEVFSNTSLKSDMDSYTKAHSISQKYSENFSKSGSNSKNIDIKNMPEVIEKFIDNDPRLKGMYESDSIDANRKATSEATNRINTAIRTGFGADFNSLQKAFQEVDLGSNISNLVNTQIDQGKNLDSNVSNSVSSGKDNVSNTSVNNTINQNPTNNYQSQADDFINKSTEDMNKHKENIKLNTQDTIQKGSEILEDRNKENADDSRSGKAFVAMGGGFGDIKKGIENFIEHGNKDTAYITKDGNPLPSNNLSDIQNPIPNIALKDNTGNQQLSDVKMQLDFIKDDLNEINSANTQIPEKKGGKK
ncbi:conjugal transfer protein TraG N-terminal domain-containing protein [Arcobacter lanthieri]|uniref:conjugal transfer protein TraG N-terminal domain-containing protein n=1 Tax=Aliarcobacter lanthieri TaxID=1355374 RepID=UPI0019222269|nr:conjugal transfer protein TraG N-terminal domain-containing protein [Aliarcobacter lanthieri]MBL3518878.1 conjugal transfer protein TraG N-terminal domain-containing protein [Aliarcobacter lanthieri]